MRDSVVRGVQHSLKEMREALHDLARGNGFLSTADAVELCPFPAEDETLIGYPEYILPRFEKNPLAKRPTYLWDPRDIRDLPTVLRRWRAALRGGADATAEFIASREMELNARDCHALGLKEAA